MITNIDNTMFIDFMLSNHSFDSIKTYLNNIPNNIDILIINDYKWHMEQILCLELLNNLPISLKKLIFVNSYNYHFMSKEEYDKIKLPFDCIILFCHNSHDITKVYSKYLN